MKNFLLVLLTIILATVIAMGAAAMYLYYTYLIPQPAEYQFSGPTTEITTIEIISITGLESDMLEFNTLSKIENTEAFLAEFSELECKKGVTPEAINEMNSASELKAIQITYADGGQEIITAFANLNSDMFESEFDINAILGKAYYSFNPEEFGALIDKYFAE